MKASPSAAKRFALALLVILAVVAGIPGAAARSGGQAGGLAAAGRTVHLPLIRNPAPVQPPPPPPISADLTIRPVPLSQVQRGDTLSVEYRYRNEGQQAITARISLFYPSRLLSFNRVDAANDAYVGHDATRVIVEVRNVAPGQLRTGRINFIVFSDSPEGSRVGLFSEFTCRTGVTCRSNFAEVEVIRNADEGTSGGTFTMSVSPDRGPPGTAHTFSGSRFRPNEPFVTWLNTPSGVLPLSISGRADSAGRIQFTYGTGQLTTAGFYSMVAHGQQSNVQNVGPFIVQINGQPSALASADALTGGAALPAADEPAPIVAAAPAQAEGDGGIAGRVLDGAGAGVAGVSVEIVSAAGELVAVTESRADGVYFVAGGLATGQYTVTARPALGAGLDLLADAAAGAAVSSPEMTRDVNLTLPAAGGLAGLVRAGGSPAANVLVSAVSAAGEVAGADVTDVNGLYRITNLLPGPYSLRFDPQATARAGLYRSGDLTAPTVTAGQVAAVDAVDLLASQRTGVIAGSVSDAATGDPIGDVLVVITRVDGAQGETFVSVARSEGDGSYSSDPLAPGSYRVQFVTLFSDVAATAAYSGEFFNDAPTFAESDPVTVVAGLQSTADAGLALGGSVAGNVGGAGAGALADVPVVALDEAGVPRAFAITNEAGDYRLGGLRPGAYTVRAVTSVSSVAANRAFADGGYDTTPATPDLTPVSVGAGAAVAGIDITLRPGAQIFGAVSAGDTGEPLAGVLVAIIRTSGDSPSLAGLARTDAEGAYASPALAPGTYTLWFSTILAPDAAVRSYQSEFFSNKPSLAAADPILVGAAGSRIFRGAELVRGGAVVGRVSAADTGDGLGGVFVLAQFEGGIVGGAITDDGGYYSLAGLPGGQVTIGYDPRFSPDPSARGYGATSLPVTVTVGAEATQDVQLSPLP